MDAISTTGTVALTDDGASADRERLGGHSLRTRLTLRPARSHLPELDRPDRARLSLGGELICCLPTR